MKKVVNKMGKKWKLHPKPQNLVSHYIALSSIHMIALYKKWKNEKKVDLTAWFCYKGIA